MSEKEEIKKLVFWPGMLVHSVIAALEKLKQEDHRKFKVRHSKFKTKLNYISRLCPSTPSKKTPKPKTNEKKNCIKRPKGGSEVLQYEFCTHILIDMKR